MLQASKDTITFAPETALLLLSDDLKLCPILSYPSLLTEHEAETAGAKGTGGSALYNSYRWVTRY